MHPSVPVYEGHLPIETKTNCAPSICGWPVGGALFPGRGAGKVVGAWLGVSIAMEQLHV